MVSARAVRAYAGRTAGQVLRRELEAAAGYAGPLGLAYNAYTTRKRYQNQLNEQIRKFQRPSKKKRSAPTATGKASTGGGLARKTFAGSRSKRAPMTFKKFYSEYKKDQQGQRTVQYGRRVTTGNVAAVVNTAAYSDRRLLARTQLEAIASNFIKRIDNEGGTTAVDTIDMSGVTGSKLNIDSAVQKLELRNNGLTPAVVRVYQLVNKQEVAEAPSTLVINGITDVGGIPGTAGAADPKYFPSDSPIFLENYKILNTTEYHMKCGDEVTCHMAVKDLVYDPDSNDLSGKEEFVKGLTHWIMIRVQGVVCHDSVTSTAVGYCPATIDFVQTNKVSVVDKTGDGLTRISTAWSNQAYGSITTSVVGCHDVEQV